ncbi:hypothetical protein PAESOLCIP111_03972 [Paenibacillus solanacearum]|uniref:Uncharacterized protein n=1 Tax=Paenibacillus solanacearum TaxID=2048548 RepID=A0A916K4Q0_9BACL|nr:hypothetical protein [Paenibacillus solanacearum]CAG7638742.1 hypothetical protein PAESOLCIP111_03972 [Paenibacillus solanacearum]
MNRSRYVPFERNRYFYGKLLTVRDFMSEQMYFMDKRRLLNRLLFGSGVITGLQVVAVDDKSVSVETGVALDALGREIVLPSPVTLKLSNMEGFTNNEYAKNVYLCIAYEEKGKEPMHTAATTGRDEGVSEYNRILESYRLFIREQPPSPAHEEYDDLIEHTSVWYGDPQLRILQTVPRYIEPGHTFDLRITIEKTLQTPQVAFEYVPEWSGVEAVEPLPEGKIAFMEPTDGAQTVYTMVIRMRALPLAAGETKRQGVLGAKVNTVRLVVGDILHPDLSSLRQTIEVSEQPAEQRMMQAFHTRSLDRATDSSAEPCVYLAKIDLLQMGATYVIDRVACLPFQDYVINPSILHKVLSARGKAAGETAGSAGIAQASPASVPKPAAFPDIKDEFRPVQEPLPQEYRPIVTGVAEISILPQEKKKWYERREKNFYSDEMEHGLGPGAIFLSACLSDEREEEEVLLPDMWNRKDVIYSGPHDVFAGSEYAMGLANVSVGWVLYPKKGTFRIGVRVHRKTERTRLRVRWWAVQASESEAAPASGSLPMIKTMQEAAVSRHEPV